MTTPIERAAQATANTLTEYGLAVSRRSGVAQAVPRAVFASIDPDELARVILDAWSAEQDGTLPAPEKRAATAIIAYLTGEKA